MQFAHLAEQIQVLDIPYLNLLRQLVVVGTFTLTELLIRGATFCRFLIGKMFLHDDLHLLFHVGHLLMRDVC